MKSLDPMISLLILCCLFVSNLAKNIFKNVFVTQFTSEEVEQALLHVRSLWVTNNKLEETDAGYNVLYSHACYFDSIGANDFSVLEKRFAAVDTVLHNLNPWPSIGERANIRLSDKYWRNLLCMAQVSNQFYNASIFFTDLAFVFVGDVRRSFVNSVNTNYFLNPSRSSYMLCIRPSAGDGNSLCDLDIMAMSGNFGQEMVALLNASAFSSLTASGAFSVCVQGLFKGISFFEHSNLVIKGGQDWDTTYDLNNEYFDKIALLEIDGDQHVLNINDCIPQMFVKWYQFNTVGVITSVIERAFLSREIDVRAISGCADSEIYEKNAQQSSLLKLKQSETIIEASKGKNRSRIIDTFMFNDEIELLLLRLEVLKDIVDVHVIVESDFTFTGKRKVLHFLNNMTLFSAYAHKIIPVHIVELPFANITTNQQVWENEYFSRNAIADGLRSANVKENDIVLLADVDEIPVPNAIHEILKFYDQTPSDRHRIFKFYPTNFMYDFNCFVGTNKPLQGGALTALTFGLLEALGEHPHFVTEARHYKQRSSSTYPLQHVIFPGSWHLSYFGGIERIRSKLDSYSHQNIARSFRNQTGTLKSSTLELGSDISTNLVAAAVTNKLNLIGNLSAENPNECKDIILAQDAVELKHLWNEIVGNVGNRQRNTSEAETENNGKRIASISGFVGDDVDFLYIPLNMPSFIDSYFISNNRDVAEFAERLGLMSIIVDIPLRIGSESAENYRFNSFESKRLKIFPQVYIKMAREKYPNRNLPDNYDFVIWADNKFNVNWDRILPVIHSWNSEIAMMMGQVSEGYRGDVYKQFYGSMHQPRYALERDKLENYIQSQVVKGFATSDVNGGRSLASGFIIYNMHHQQTRYIQDTWFEHILQAGIQCQISLYFLAQNFTKEIAVLDKAWNNGRINIHDNYDDAKLYLFNADNETAVLDSLKSKPKLVCDKCVDD